MNLLKKFLDFGIFCLALLLVFLIVFEKFLVLPLLVAWLGHWHPVILHFPIVMIIVVIVQYWRRDPYLNLYLGSTALFSLIAAITGFLLSMDGGEKGDLVVTHQWLAISFCLVVVTWYWMAQGDRFGKKLYVGLQSFLVILIIITGHFGGMLTHGEKFISLPFSNEPEKTEEIMSENPNIYSQIIQPILDTKCASCHNPNKSKGKLVLTSYAALLKGGETGPVVDFDNQDNSLILKNIHSPLDDDRHMPPKEEKQLGRDELVLLTDWIESGAREEMYFNELDENLESHEIIAKRISESFRNKWAELPEVSDNELTKISSNYLSVARIYNQADALQVTIFPSENFKAGDVKVLKPLATNIVELNLKGLTLNKEDIIVINSMDHLETLDLSSTSLDDELISHMTNVENLKLLKIYDTKVSDASLDLIKSLPSLEKVYVYHTKMTNAGISNLIKRRYDIQIVSESEIAKSFESVLPTPTASNSYYFFREPFKLFFDHPLKGIDIFYKNSSRPEEDFSLFSDSIVIDSDAKLSFYAAKDGWEPSLKDSLTIFKSIYTPDSTALKYLPESKYQGKGISLLFDLKKGPDDYGDSSWMAFRNEPFSLLSTWSQPITVHSVVVSTIIQTDPYLFSPESIIVRGGKSLEEMKLLGTLKPSIQIERAEKHFEYLECAFEPAQIQILQIEVTPLQKIPSWHDGKGEKAWFFIDEVVLR